MESPHTLMKRKYEGVFILKLQGQDETIDEMVGNDSRVIRGHAMARQHVDCKLPCVRNSDVHRVQSLQSESNSGTIVPLEL